jgi:broad specificity phosphatase PhoE
MQLILIRHGQMQGDPYCRPAHPVQGCLSPTGEAQAARLAQATAKWKIDEVHASPLGRAHQTAQAIATPRNLPITLQPWIEEWKPATQTGECADPRDLAIREAQSAKRRPEHAWKTPAGEGTFEMAHRVIVPLLEFLRERGLDAAHGGFHIAPEAIDRRIAIVAHGGSLSMVAAFILGFPLRPYGPFSFSLTGVGVIDFVQRAEVWYPHIVIQPLLPEPM